MLISSEAAWGAVVRDERGSVIASSWNVIDDCQSAEMAEGVACLEGIKWVRGFSALPLIVESDCQGLITTLLDPTETRSSLRPVIQEIRHLAPFDPGIQFKFTSRVNNGVAHEIAKFCVSSGRGGVVLEGVPPCAERSLAYDCKNIPV